MHDHIEKIKKLYISSYGETIANIQQIPVAGSERNYFRIYSDKVSVVAAYGNNIAENKTFLYLTKQFAAQGITVPSILAVSNDFDCYIMDDLGNESLLDFVTNHSNVPGGEEKIIEMYQKVLLQLIEIQITVGKTIDYSKCFARESFDKEQLYFDLNYFKYYFLKLAELPFHEQNLEKDFKTFVEFIGEEQNQYFMYRDFQARNIFIKDGKPWFIDYQGGMRGPLQYDLASLLYQSRARLSESVRHSLLLFYIDEVAKFVPIDKTRFIDRYYAIVLSRTLQTLGAYGFRGVIQKKALFLNSIPQSLEILFSISEKLKEKIAIPCLFSIIEALKKSATIDKIMKQEKLKVSICSFSYKRGIPVDTSGNGGGFVFDCRAINNPGLIDEYKHLTGKDQPVMNYLEQESDIVEFLEHAYVLISKSVEKYISRGFNSLMVCFGCTGGRHRSVYSAEKIAALLNQNYDINVEIIHFEQATW